MSPCIYHLSPTLGSGLLKGNLKFVYVEADCFLPPSSFSALCFVLPTWKLTLSFSKNLEQKREGGFFLKKKIGMGLSNLSCAAEGVLPVLVMNTVLSVALLKNMLRSLLQVVGATGSSSSNLDEDSDYQEENIKRERRVSITQFKSLCHNRSSIPEGSSSSSSSAPACACTCGVSGSTVECCVCLCGFEADEEVSELSCKHFFHKGCLEEWFDNKHSTCPLCRSIY